MKKRIGAVFGTRHHATRRESGLFHIAVIVLRVLVEDQTTKLMHPGDVSKSKSLVGGVLLETM